MAKGNNNLFGAVIVLIIIIAVGFASTTGGSSTKNIAFSSSDNLLDLNGYTLSSDKNSLTLDSDFNTSENTTGFTLEVPEKYFEEDEYELTIVYDFSNVENSSSDIVLKNSFDSRLNDTNLSFDNVVYEGFDFDDASGYMLDYSNSNNFAFNPSDAIKGEFTIKYIVNNELNSVLKTIEYTQANNETNIVSAYGTFTSEYPVNVTRGNLIGFDFEGTTLSGDDTIVISSILIE